MIRSVARAAVVVAALAAAAPARAATVCPEGTLAGVDVTSAVGPVDWAAVRRAGASFAFVGATAGAGAVAPGFAASWAGAKAAGLVRGAYHVFSPAADPDAQADAFLAAVGTIEPGDLRLAVDVETLDAQSAASVEIALARFVTRLEQAEGPPVILRTNPTFWTGSMEDSTAFRAEALWIVDPAGCPDLPPAWTSWTFQGTGAPGPVAGTLAARFAGGPAELDLLRVQAPCGSAGAPTNCALPPAEPGGATSCASDGGAGGLAIALALAAALRLGLRGGGRGRRSRPRARPSPGSAAPPGDRGRRAASGW
jgi:lysozyme